MSGCHVGLGGNVGDVREAFRDAVCSLESAGLEVTSVSGLYRTAAVGEEAGPAFLNAAIGVRTTLPPESVLDILQDIEQSLGRTRTRRWGPRTIDLDLLLFGALELQTSRLTLPHPACWYRRFVLDPLAEIAGWQIHPRCGLTIDELRERLRSRPLAIALVGGGTAQREESIRQIADSFGVETAIVAADDALAEPAIIFCFPDARHDEKTWVNRAWRVEHVDAASTVVETLQAAIDTPVRIAEPDEWDPRID